MTVNNSRPDRTTMEGMIWNANNVLAEAMKPGYNGIHHDLFKNCKGLILLSVVEAGFIFSGNVGTGIILAKKSDGNWSVPCACGLAGIGWGFLFGGSVKDVVVFLMDESSLGSALGENGVKLGAQAELTIGPFGRSGKLDLAASGRGVGGTLSIAFAKGAFVGISLEGALVGARHAVNASFYGKDESPRNILLNDAVTFPEDKDTAIDEVYDKLKQLAQGGNEEEEIKVVAAPTAAEQVISAKK